MSERARELREELLQEVSTAGTVEALKSVRDKWLARETGLITGELKRLRELPREQRPAFGQAMNELRQFAEQLLEERRATVQVFAPKDKLDVTRPGFPFGRGHEHPIKRLQGEIEDVFVSMGFRVFDLPEIEDEHHNFEALNIPANHPARDSQDTFYLADGIMLRGHCSTVQIHAMEVMKPPIRAVSTGKVFRRDPFDATHSPMFFQVDVLVVDQGITMGDLKGTLEMFLKNLFGSDIRMRLRPGFFPFVEPGAEVDISCIFCGGQGCRICKQSGWVEILGAGMVHPKVLRMAGVDDGKYSGFAWGMGIDRVAILKYGVDDIRLFFENDLRFLAQF